MSKRIFISYSHKQKQWVHNNLVPCLHAGGVEVYTDQNHFRAGKALSQQMVEIQKNTDISILVLTPDYLRSSHCLFEMKNAIASDPEFRLNKIIPILRKSCSLPKLIKRSNPLFVDLRDDTKSKPWDVLLQACRADLGTDAPGWINARDCIVKFLQRNESVNLVVHGKPKWRELIEHLKHHHFPQIALVDLTNPATNSRRGLVSTIVRATGQIIAVPPEPEDLVVLAESFERLSSKLVLTIQHLDLIKFRPYDEDISLFSALRYLLMESCKLVLLTQSRTSFENILPKVNPLSEIYIHNIELRGVNNEF